MSTVWTSASMSLTAVHSYVPALCLLIDGISRYSSSDAMSPTKGHTHTKQKKKWRRSFRGPQAASTLLASVLVWSAALSLQSKREKHVDSCRFWLARVGGGGGCNSSTYEDVCSEDATRTATVNLFLALAKKQRWERSSGMTRLWEPAKSPAATTYGRETEKCFVRKLHDAQPRSCLRCSPSHLHPHRKDPQRPLLQLADTLDTFW